MPPNKGGGIMGDAGPVTLGTRLTSSKFPAAYEPVVYGRGTWLIHMLRCMLREAGPQKNDALFFKALKDLLAGSPNGKLSTLDLQRAFERVMPPSLAYEGHKSLDWFFDGWVNGISIPEFSLEDVKIPPAGAKLKARGTIRERFADKDLVTAVPVYARTRDGQLKWVIDNGIEPSGMPASKGILSDEEIWSTILFIRHLPPAGSLGDPPIYSK